jgi:hypothetical protein
MKIFGFLTSSKSEKRLADRSIIELISQLEGLLLTIIDKAYGVVSKKVIKRKFHLKAQVVTKKPSKMQHMNIKELSNLIFVIDDSIFSVISKL